MLRQIHSALIVEATEQTGYIGEGDALITRRPGLLIGVRTADCVPILLVDSKKRVVAAVHAGWRGSAKQIVVSSITELQSRYGTSPSDLFAAIGPAIGPCCYEVGPDVARQFVTWWPELQETLTPQKIDLPETNRRQLMTAGVPEAQIDCGAPCTACTPSFLHSYRRDKEAAGRMIAAIGIIS